MPGPPGCGYSPGLCYHPARTNLNSRSFCKPSYPSSNSSALMVLASAFPELERTQVSPPPWTPTVYFWHGRPSRASCFPVTSLPSTATQPRLPWPSPHPASASWPAWHAGGDASCLQVPLHRSGPCPKMVMPKDAFLSQHPLPKFPLAGTVTASPKSQDQGSRPPRTGPQGQWLSQQVIPLR